MCEVKNIIIKWTKIDRFNKPGLSACEIPNQFFKDLKTFAWFCPISVAFMRFENGGYSNPTQIS